MFKGSGQRWKAAVRIVSLLLICVTVTGCWDSTEIDELAIIMASGTDIVNSSSGSQSTLLGSAQIAVPRQLGSTQGGGPTPSMQEPFLVESATGRDPVELIENVRKKVARKLILSHRQVVVVGEDYAKTGVRSLLDEILRNPGSRLRTSFVVGYHSDALSILNLPRLLTRVPSEAIEGLEEQYGFENYSVKDFMVELTGKGDPYTLGIEPVTTQSKETPKTFLLHNIAVFQKDKLVGWLEGQQVQGFLWMSDRMKTGLSSVNLPNLPGTVGVKLLRSRVVREVHMIRGKPQITIKLQIEDDVIENGTSLNLHDPKAVAVVEAAVQKSVESEMKETLDVLQHQYHADILGFGDLIYKKSPRAWRKMEGNWRKEFAKIPVQFDTQVQIRRAGLTSPNLKIPEQELK
jgi:spore germination protein KC